MGVTREDVARRAGTSGTTVSFVLSGNWRKHKINTRTAERVREAARELNYVPNRAAQELRLNRSGRVALLLPGITRYFHGLVLAAFHRAAAERGIGLMTYFVESDTEMSDSLAQAHSQSDGVLLWGLRLSREHSAALQQAAVPVVRVQLMERRSHLKTDTITLDHERAVREALGLLRERGYTDLYFTSHGPPRVRAIRKVLDEWGLSLDEDRLIRPEVNDYSHGPVVAGRVRIRPDGTTGILADNDTVAIGCMGVLERREIYAGRDYGLVGFDDIPAAPYLRVPLTTLRLPYDEIATESFNLLDAKWKDGGDGRKPRTLRLPLRLIERQSTRRENAP